MTLLSKVLRTGPSQREAVIGTGAAADLIQQNQAVGGGVVQNVGGLSHFNHKR